MTLYRQLVSFILLLLVLLLSCVWYDKLKNTKQFFESQLESNAQDTATSLGLSLTPHIAQNDIATVETMINAVFDRGYFQSIILRGIDGETIYEKKQDVMIDGVPPWFVNNIKLEIPQVTSLVMSGWNQSGSLIISGHPGFAYKSLWNTIIHITVFFIFVTILALITGSIILKILLRPLHSIEKQALSLCNREFFIQERIPYTRELKRVVEAMNTMTSKIQTIFIEQAETAERIQKSAYTDELTGLGNRRYMAAQIQAKLDSSEPVIGGFILVHIHELQSINFEKGYTQGDHLVSEIAEILNKETLHLANSAAARISGSDFAIFIPEISTQNIEQLIKNIAEGLNQLSLQKFASSNTIASIGAVSFESPLSFSDLLIKADSALQKARQSGKNGYFLSKVSNDTAVLDKGKQEWKSILSQVIANKSFRLLGQPVFSAINPAECRHTEIFSQITLESGNIIPASTFIPLAQQFNLAQSFDTIVLEKVFSMLPGWQKSGGIAVNLSTSSLKDDQFCSWVYDQLRQNVSQVAPIIFELNEFMALQAFEEVKSFARAVQQLGHNIGIDHFGKSFGNFGYLTILRPSYIKIDKAYTDELEENRIDSQFFISSLCSAAHSLDIKIIAEGIEKQTQLKSILDVNIDAVQGFLLGKPELLT